MAKSTTYDGKPKPYAGQGHFFESRRHSLQAKGILTGHKADEISAPISSEPFIDLGILNTEGEQMKVQQKADENVPRTEEGLEDIEAEAELAKEAEPKKETFGEKIKEFGEEVKSGFEREKAILARKRREKIDAQLGRESEEDPDQMEADAEMDTMGFGGGSKYGLILADLFGTYNSEDMVDVNEQELEDLAMKFDAQTQDNFLKPHNPFMEELKNRIKAKEDIRLAKIKIDAELEPSRQQVRKEIAEIRGRALTGDNRDWMEKLVGF